MAEFHVRLALDYLQARSRSDWTEAALAGIVQHISDTYLLSLAERQEVQQAALAQAHQRQLLAAPV